MIASTSLCCFLKRLLSCLLSRACSICCVRDCVSCTSPLLQASLQVPPQLCMQHHCISRMHRPHLAGSRVSPQVPSHPRLQYRLRSLIASTSLGCLLSCLLRWLLSSACSLNCISRIHRPPSCCFLRCSPSGVFFVVLAVLTAFVACINFTSLPLQSPQVPLSRACRINCIG